ncbi:hypothetical protein CLOSTMETH_00119 [[Clostridium] methylpentosum DSM 5476]|uniref:Uncharacterized protein n=1 Tax=[Clostridium] methylpentosum DSM 5476 TaxID=537013 RepID=C0E8H4_9FIRM|nr:hypothetical protein CLOSTMETH_00119 [[Clostridium] methylpentosum DSM 5476]
MQLLRKDTNRLASQEVLKTAHTATANTVISPFTLSQAIPALTLCSRRYFRIHTGIAGRSFC